MRQIFWYAFLVFLFVKVFTYSQTKEKESKDAMTKEVVIQKAKFGVLSSPFKEDK